MPLSTTDQFRVIPTSDFNATIPRCLQAGGCALWEWRPACRRFSFSDGFWDLLGYPNDAKPIPGRDPARHISPRDLGAIVRQIERELTRNRDTVHFEFQVADVNGKTRWISGRGRVIEGQQVPSVPKRAEAAALCVTGTLSDVTTYRLIRATTADNRRNLAGFLDTLPGMFYRSVPADGAWRIVYVSQGIQNLLGYDPVYFLENRDAIYAELVAPEDYQRIWEAVDRAIIEKRSYQLYYRMRTASGDFKWVWEQGEVAFGADGEPTSMQGLVADVTRQKELEIELHKENVRLKSSLKDRYHFGDIIGKSASMQKVYELIEKAAASDANVILYGESGTGKELVARLVHHLSPRGEAEFVPVNCGAIPENLLESEFFGHKKGAFTGAHKSRRGYLAAADKGTLFLDELGEISPNFQVKLLRVLEGQGYSPLGDTHLQVPDIRIVAATHNNLMEMIRRGKMREDFFFRIHIIPITLPPLRERKEDIPLLIDHFLEKFQPGQVHGLKAGELSTALSGYDWPGNVRELQNTIQRYVALGEVALAWGDSPAVVPTPLNVRRDQGALARGLRNEVEKFEKEVLVSALEAQHWHRDKTARLLKITPRTLYRKMQRYRLG